MNTFSTFLFFLLSILLLSPNSFAKYWGFGDVDYHKNWNTSRVAYPDLVVRAFDEELNTTISIISWSPGNFARGFRTELSDESLAPNDLPIYYSFWFKIPKDFELNEGDSCVVMQFHTPDSLHKPQLAFRARGNKRLDITLNHKTAHSPEHAQQLQMKVAKIDDFPRGQWQKVEMLIQWSHSHGYIKINMNKIPVLRYKGKTNFNSQPTGPYTYIENPSKKIMNQFK